MRYIYSFNGRTNKELTCCDLLEKSYLCGINNNDAAAVRRAAIVVICLKSLTFVVSITTREQDDNAHHSL